MQKLKSKQKFKQNLLVLSIAVALNVLPMQASASVPFCTSGAPVAVVVYLVAGAGSVDCNGGNLVNGTTSAGLDSLNSNLDSINAPGYLHAGTSLSSDGTLSVSKAKGSGLTL